MLFADVLCTGAIFWLYLNVLLLIFGDRPQAVIEILALFSVVSLFFYSTFLTSVWAWIYCLSTWFMRLFSQSALRSILDVENKPVEQIAIVGAALIFVIAVCLAPVLKKDDQQQISAFDDILCSVFPENICSHVSRLTEDAERKLGYLDKGCEGGSPGSCNSLGWLYREGRGVAQDYTKATALYRQACDGGYARGCDNLGWLYQEGHGVVQDYTKAAALYRQACDGGFSLGCDSLGWLYQEGRGMAQDYTKATALHQQACDDGYARACDSLGWLYQEGHGVAQDYTKAVVLHQQACDDG